jgi:hypothetical protein
MTAAYDSKEDKRHPYLLSGDDGLFGPVECVGEEEGEGVWRGSRRRGRWGSVMSAEHAFLHLEGW